MPDPVDVVRLRETKGLSFDQLMGLAPEEVERFTALLEAIEGGRGMPAEIEAVLWAKVFTRLDAILQAQTRLERALKAHGVGAWQEPA